MNLRPYTTDDRAACLLLFDSNVPVYFDQSERRDFEEFLDHEECAYFVVEDENGQIVGCGGYHLERETRLGSICYGMIANHLHGKGIGSFLLRERLKRLSQELEEGESILVYNQTSQHTAPFYEKFGFVTAKITQNAFAAGLHCYEMFLKLERFKG
jgi:ribosomal protein S18 acetylase RimI-like enzyme